MRHPDITIWTAGPPKPVSECTAQVRGGPVGVATYFYWIISHYPIGSVIGGPFVVRGAPKPTDSQHYVVISWTPVSARDAVISYDVLRTQDASQPADGALCALALGVTTTIFLDQGQPLLPYNLSGLPHGSTTDGWAFMNNRDYAKPVLELWPTIRIKSVLFTDGTEQDSAAGGGAIVVNTISPGNLSGNITLSPGAGVSITQSGQIITIGATGLWSEGAAGAIYYSGGNVGIKNSNPQFSLDIVGSVNATGGFFINGTLFAGTGVPLIGGVSAPSVAHVAGTPPASPVEGQFWYNASARKLFIRYADNWDEIGGPQ